MLPWTDNVVNPIRLGPFPPPLPLPHSLCPFPPPHSCPSPLPFPPTNSSHSLLSLLPSFPSSPDPSIPHAAYLLPCPSHFPMPLPSSPRLTSSPPPLPLSSSPFPHTPSLSCTHFLLACQSPPPTKKVNATCRVTIGPPAIERMIISSNETRESTEWAKNTKIHFREYPAMHFLEYLTNYKSKLRKIIVRFFCTRKASV